jgi:isoprenylcysteine carboxyl methyltransferase (ICMT) family protein YpbQ
MEHLLWKILETVGLLLFVVAMIATTLIHTIGYIRFMVGRLRAEDKAVGGKNPLRPGR